jgi:hypothetical protein
LNNNSYNGVEITAVKRLSHKWQILGGFTIQRQKGVYGRGFSDEATSGHRRSHYRRFELFVPVQHHQPVRDSLWSPLYVLTEATIFDLKSFFPARRFG